jgi:hypothetical protein
LVRPDRAVAWCTSLRLGCDDGGLGVAGVQQIQHDQPDSLLAGAATFASDLVVA